MVVPMIINQIDIKQKLLNQFSTAVNMNNVLTVIQDEINLYVTKLMEIQMFTAVRPPAYIIHIISRIMGVDPNLFQSVDLLWVYLRQLAVARNSDGSRACVYETINSLWRQGFFTAIVSAGTNIGTCPTDGIGGTESYYEFYLNVTGPVETEEMFAPLTKAVMMECLMAGVYLTFIYNGTEVVIPSSGKKNHYA
jgi:hypothetical protein